MKPLPPTLREKRRYLLARITPRWSVGDDSRLIYQAVVEAITSLFGDAGGAQIQAAVVFSQDDYIIIRCRRGMERHLEIALATVHQIGENPARMRTISTSGTMRTLKEKMKVPPPVEEESGVSIHGKDYAAYLQGRQKIDLIAKNNKSQKLLFFTQKEVEEI
ncbi:MAG TPA: Rpp14/Pop5 family protein [Methanomicrobiales archaeon]|nr:Rpp14/Pop5 family protein [Methanomicrobiales archaeon]